MGNNIAIPQTLPAAKQKIWFRQAKIKACLTFKICESKTFSKKLLRINACVDLQPSEQDVCAKHWKTWKKTIGTEEIQVAAINTRRRRVSVENSQTEEIQVAAHNTRRRQLSVKTLGERFFFFLINKYFLSLHFKSILILVLKLISYLPQFLKIKSHFHFGSCRQPTKKKARHCKRNALFIQ